MSRESENIQTMANLLRQGAVLTKHSCPVCSTPLLKMKSGELWCSKCQKRVVVVEEGAQSTEAISPMFLGEIELVILEKIRELSQKIKNKSDLDDLQRVSEVLSSLLETLEKIKGLKRA